MKTKLFEIKQLFARKNNIPVLFAGKVLRETPKAVYIYGKASIETTKTGRCCMCGRELSHPVSVELGIGPECGKHYWNWDSIGGYTMENLQRLKGELQNVTVDQWFPKSIVIAEEEVEHTQIDVPADHKQLKDTAKNPDRASEKTIKQVQYPDGKAAIKIEFPFNMETLQLVKSLPWRKFHSTDKGKYWSCLLDPENLKKLLEWGFKPDEKLEKFHKYSTTTIDDIEPLKEIEGLQGTLREYQQIGVSFVEQKNGRALIADEMGLGKEQPLYCKLLTPFGWKKMGDIQIGDLVIGINGIPTRVEGVYPQGKKDAYEVLFTDGSRTECGLDHLWNVRDVNRRSKKKDFVTKTTKELLERGLQYPHGGNKWDIPLPKAVRFSKKEYLIHPYLLGVLIGDGYLRGTSVAFSNPDIDKDITERIKTYYIPKGCQFREDNRTDKNHCPQHLICGIVHKQSPILTEIRSLKLNVKSKEKFIPKKYKLGSIRQRLELIKGLMDTDGTVTKKGVALFCTTGHRLANDVVEVVRSLGGIAYIRQYGNDFQIPIFLNYCPFYTQRKKQAWKQTKKQIGNSHGRRGKFIKEINYIGKTEQQCISVESKDGLYITDDYIVTHNTMQAIGYMQLHPELRPAVIIGPKIVKGKWAEEIIKWMSNPGEVQILDGKKPDVPITGDIIVINYDILANQYNGKKEIAHTGWVDYILDKNPKILVTDECHYYKSNTAKRTKAVKKLAKRIPNMIALSGTPIDNRPIEIWNAINLLNSSVFSNFMTFGKKYCAGKHNGFGWDFSGASNLSELHSILENTVMIRRKKKDVLKELPDKAYSYVPFDLDNQDDYTRAVADFLDFIRERKGEKAAFKAEAAETLQRINTLRQLAVEGKMRQVIEWIKDFLENSDEKLVVFGWHTNILNAVFAEFKEIAVKIDGSTNNREAVYQTFQTDQKCRLFVGQMKAAGIGIELTAASNVAIIELPWSPGVLDQAIDRLHRIGQKNAVLVHYLLAANTIEQDMAQLVDKKRNINSQTLDGIEAEEFDMINELIDNLVK
jgi:hypothetical protein